MPTVPGSCGTLASSALNPGAGEEDDKVDARAVCGGPGGAAAPTRPCRRHRAAWHPDRARPRRLFGETNAGTSLPYNAVSFGNPPRKVTARSDGCHRNGKLVLWATAGVVSRRRA